jgi:hypothetical protein
MDNFEEIRLIASRSGRGHSSSDRSIPGRVSPLLGGDRRFVGMPYGQGQPRPVGVERMGGLTGAGEWKDDAVNSASVSTSSWKRIATRWI